jgi:hypothetical protein
MLPPIFYILEVNMPKRKTNSWDTEEQEFVITVPGIKEEVKIINEVPVEKKLREIVLSGFSVNDKFPHLTLGDPNPDVLVIVKPDGSTCTGRYKAVEGQWRRI